MTIIFLLLCEYLTALHSFKQRWEARSKWNTCEVSAKVFGKFYSQIHYLLFPTKEGGIDCCSAEGVSSSWHSNQWDNWVESTFFHFADGIKLGRTARIPVHWLRLQSDPDKCVRTIWPFPSPPVQFNRGRHKLYSWLGTNAGREMTDLAAALQKVITGDEKKNMSQHCAKKANLIWRGINRSFKYRPVKIVPVLHLAL